HSHEKQKGRLRLDDPKYILRGGKNGEVLAAGNPDESELYQRLILPDDDDKKMPPKGKSQLSKEEIEIIRWWILQGNGDFNVVVENVIPDEYVNTVLASWNSGNEKAQINTSESGSTMVIPEVAVDRPKQQDIEALQNLGIVISYLTPEKTFVSVNLVNNPSFSDEQAKALLRLSDQIAWLDLSGTEISDKALQHIGKFKNLTRLRLDKTNITDESLLHMKDASNLVYLNLYGTSITDKGLDYLKDLKQLRALYLWQSQVTPAGVAKLKKELGDKVEINNGLTS
ncbi:MAG: ribonuclease inhibitor, partial [Bacteroidota bacterium]|nr:ribonuclease inhibitor [Bacteroidota bacterium]